MAGLREAGIVQSGRGNGGGWRLNRALSEIRLGDVHNALGQPNLFAIGNRNRPSECLIERNVNAAIADTMNAATSIFLDRFDEITLNILKPTVADPSGNHASNHR
ncbi:Rrf2 family transcriptional regulator [Allopontixanthobacter confluentis]|uniref:Rrf2 family transcriptional regulator n=1 Tax=Allopontixanthobacter confluentis TaxID=1849021 RepID=UPI001E478B74|nr:Rrf2 family transcriptional regulator [Allopontixanthobacter confluentis]